MRLQEIESLHAQMRLYNVRIKMKKSFCEKQGSNSQKREKSKDNSSVLSLSLLKKMKKVEDILQQMNGFLPLMREREMPTLD